MKLEILAKKIFLNDASSSTYFAVIYDMWILICYFYLTYERKKQKNGVCRSCSIRSIEKFAEKDEHLKTYINNPLLCINSSTRFQYTLLEIYKDLEPRQIKFFLNSTAKNSVFTKIYFRKQIKVISFSNTQTKNLGLKIRNIFQLKKFLYFYSF